MFSTTYYKLKRLFLPPPYPHIIEWRQGESEEEFVARVNIESDAHAAKYGYFPVD